MMNKEERMKKLANANIETGKYFTFEIPEGLAPNTKIHLVFDESGVATIVNETEISSMYEQIIEDGYVRNTKLFRRWTTAQMFKMLNYRSWDGRREGYNEALKVHGYNYIFTMMLEEVRVLSKLEVRDFESFRERSHFFTKDVVVKVCEDYMNKLEAYIDNKPNKNCKGVPYKAIKGQNIFVEDLPKKIYQPLQYKINRIKWANNYTEIYRELRSFMRDMIKLPWETPMSKDWVDAYKGNGSFYTCKNLLMFHGCCVKRDSMYGNSFYTRDESMAILNSKLNEYQGEGWRMFAFMKKLIADNKFDFYKVMDEKHNK